MAPAIGPDDRTTSSTNSHRETPSPRSAHPWSAATTTAAAATIPRQAAVAARRTVRGSGASPSFRRRQ
jgi:hypothetical protein